MGELVLLDVFVPGVPAPQGSKRYLGVGSKGKVRMAESSKKVEPWRSDIRNAIDPQITTRVEDGAARVDLDFVLLRPASHYRTTGALNAAGRARPYPRGRPDLDKLIRAVLDAVGSTGRVWTDDAQVAHVNAWKRYADRGEPAGVHITVRSLGWTLYAADTDGASVCMECLHGLCITRGHICEAEHCQCDCRVRPLTTEHFDTAPTIPGKDFDPQEVDKEQAAQRTTRV